MPLYALKGHGGEAGSPAAKRGHKSVTALAATTPTLQSQ